MLRQALCVISRPSVNFNWSNSPETPNLAQNRIFFSRVTLKFDVRHWKTIGHFSSTRLSFVLHFIIICEFKPELWSGNGWVLTPVTLTFDLGLWPFAWTSFLSIVIPPENIMMIWWQEHSIKGVTDGRMDGRTDRQTDGNNLVFLELLGRS